jgi:alpha-glucosidase
MSPHLLDQPHHDGSPLYVDDEAPELGATVGVRCRVAVADGVSEVWLRTTYDAEPTYHQAHRIRQDSNQKAGQDAHTVWWQAELPIRNPVAHYRFLLVGPGEQQRWLTGRGVTEIDPPDGDDFRLAAYPQAPDWGRDAVLYQIFPDRFARSAAAAERPTPDWAEPAEWEDPVAFEPDDPSTPLQFFGGDLDGIVEHLDHIESVGATVVYTTPVFPGRSNHRYNASTFDEVDPLLGGDDAYGRLSQAVHRRGWRLLGDLTTNHTGDDHEWFQGAAADPDSALRRRYYFDEAGDYECWMGHGTLPKLDHAHPETRAAMVEGPDSVVARWLRPPYDVDGWRIDVANMTGRLADADIAHDVAKAVRATAAAERGDPWVIGEHNHDAAGDVDGDGWHGTMNYSGFSWPVWSWLRDPATRARPFGRPVQVARRPGGQIVETFRAWHARLGWRAVSGSWNILGSHDSARIRTMVGSGCLQQVAVGLQFTLPGIPMIFAGDELGLQGVNGEDARRTMPWAHRDEWDTATLHAYSDLARLRREHVALRRGGLRWAYADDDALAFVREHPDESVLVVVRRAAGPAIELAAGQLGSEARRIYGGAGDLVATGDALVVPQGGPSVDIWSFGEG